MQTSRSPAGNVALFGGFRFDIPARRLFHQSADVSLNPKVLDVLAYLIENPWRIVSKDEIMREVRGAIAVTDDARVQRVLDIREALQENAMSPNFIRTHPKRGYDWIAAVADEVPPPPLPMPAAAAPQPRRMVWLAGAGSAGDQNQDSTNIRGDRGLSDFDARQRLVASVSYQLPFFRNHRILGGWQTNAIATFQSGFPLNIVAADTSGAGAFTVLRANRIGDGNLPSGDRAITRYFDTTAFQAPRPGTFGSSGRNVIIGPGINNWSWSLLKSIAFGERYALQLRGEFFNAFNHSQFFAPGASVTTPATFGRIASARSPRNVQLGAKFNF